MQNPVTAWNFPKGTFQTVPEAVADPAFPTEGPSHPVNLAQPRYTKLMHAFLMAEKACVNLGLCVPKLSGLCHIPKDWTKRGRQSWQSWPPTRGQWLEGNGRKWTILHILHQEGARHYKLLFSFLSKINGPNEPTEGENCQNLPVLFEGSLFKIPIELNRLGRG